MRLAYVQTVRNREIELTGTAIQAIEDAFHVGDQNHSIKSNARPRDGVCMYGRELKWLRTKKGGASLVKPPK